MSTFMTAARIPRPSRISILAIFILWIAILNGLRLGEAIYFWKTLDEYRVSPLYISLSGTLWLIVGVMLVWGLWQRKDWGRKAVILGTLAYTSWYWFDRLVLQALHANWPFVLFTNIMLLLIIFYILFSQKTRRFYNRDLYERQPETPTTT
jgi:hypothetical protein